MDNLKPKHRDGNKNNSSVGRGYLGPIPQHVEVSRKKEKNPEDEQGDVALSKGQTIFVSSLVIILSVTVGFLFIWIYNLQNDNREKDLVIRNLRGTIESLENEITVAASETEVPTSTYSAIPENVLPNTQDGLENPEIAVKEEFEYEKFFKNSENIINERQNITFYVCNDKAALRLIRDSQLPYLITQNSSEKFNLLLLGDYHPSWINELKELEEKRKQLLFSNINSSSTETTSGETDNALTIPEELAGLEAQEMDRFWCIQMMADTALEKLTSKVNILRNENIPAFLYNYKTSTDKDMYSMRVGFFSSYEEAEKYSKSMNRTQYLELLGKDISDRFIKLMKLD